MSLSNRKTMSKLVFTQLAILLWKSWIMRRRHWISTIFELLIPLLLSLLIAYIYSSAQKGSQNSYDRSHSTHQNNAKSDHKSDSEGSEGKTIGPRIYPNPTMTIDSFHKEYYKAIVFYGPMNSFTNDIMFRVKNYSNIEINGLANAALVNAKMESMVANDSANINSLRSTFGVIFDDKSQTAESISDFRYSIRMFGNMAFLVNRLFPSKYFPGPATQFHDYTDGFCPLQIYINDAFLSKQLESNAKERKQFSSFKAFRFPYPKYISKGNQNQVFSLQDLVAAAIVIGYVVMCPLIVKRITDEKVAKAKEMLRMIGMSDWVFWGSHFISYYTLMLFHSFMFTIFYCVGLGGDPVMHYSEGCLFFIVLAIYCAQSILFCMLITTVFNRPVLAVVVTVIIWIISYGVPLGILNPLFHPEMDIIKTNPARLLSALLPNMGLSWSLAVFGQFEVLGVGAQWKLLYSQTSVYSSLTLGLVMIVMIMSCFMYGILIWYIDNIWPFQYGVPKPFYFPFLRSYWCPSRRRTFDKDTKTKEKVDSRNFEEEPKSAANIRVKNLRKEFGGIGSRRKIAVENVSLNIYDKQITVLLGHNGAGKTTTMNMITGIFPPTSGSVHVDGYDIETETNKARRSLGLCPQENIIYNELTVAQHLKLYAIIKGYPWNLVDKEVNNTIDLLRLTDKKHALAESLSGGMKRKLALGIAIIGGTKILILDEPTSGMDPEARRAVWDVLQGIRTERTILLTTHYMEEADVLGDRIAIMSEGRVKCFGSPMFLKKRFGAGYHLRISKDFNFKGDLVEMLLRRHLPKAHLHSEIHSEVIYSLESNNNNNSSETSTSVLPNLFDEIERNKEKLGIASCGLTITTMEDVFLRVGHELDDTDDDVKQSLKSLKDKSSESLLHKSSVQLTGAELFNNRVIGLLLKRFHFAKRYWPMMCFQLLVPGLLFIVVLLSDYGIRNSITGETKSLKMDLKELYGNSNGFYQSNDLQELGSTYRTIADKYGMNTTILTTTETPNEWALKYADNLENYIKYYLIGSSINKTEDDKLDIGFWYNNEALHSLPLSINLMFEALLKHFIPEKQFSLTVINHPLSLNENTINFGAVIFGWAVSCLLLTPITVPFIGASYVLFPINERTSKAKLLQLMTGLSSMTFWICNFLFDLINHLIAIIIIYVIFAIFDFNKIYFEQTNTAIGLFLMLFLFGFASIPLAYCFSLWLKKPSTGFAVLVIIYLLFGLIANSAMGVLDLSLNVMHSEPIPKSTFDLLLSIFRFVPVFSMSFGIQKLYRIGSFAQICKEFASKQNMTFMCSYVTQNDMLYGCCKDKCEPNNQCYESKNPLRFDSYGVGQEFLYMTIDGFLFMLILLLLEGNLSQYVCRLINSKSRNTSHAIAMIAMNENLESNEDSDVIAEKHRIKGLRDRRLIKEDALAVIDLTKHFGHFTAVDHLTFGVHKEECFGLLGVNGAGKTTTFSMLTGDLLLNEGNAFIGDHCLRNDLKAFQKQIGYCPQFDALLDKLTGKEMLYLFARLRGVPSAMIPNEVQNLIHMVDLQNHANNRTETYSGGNRRKLSLALAIIGTPQVLFLDEPTAGVDPTARRKIWSTLVYIQEKYQSAIVLTSHSMEECEALCSRIAIMVNGKFKCLGPTQHLRTKFGQGFTVIIKLRRELNDDSNYVTQVQQYIQRSIPSAVLKDIHQCLLHYHITDTSVLWSHLFRVMESAKGQLQLEDYLVSDTTLEQIFLAFARSQRVVVL